MSFLQKEPDKKPSDSETKLKLTVEESSDDCVKILNSGIINSAICADHLFVKENVSKEAIFTLTKDFITVTIIRTPYARVQLRIQYTNRYPNETPIIELSSPTLPFPLLRAKEKECVDLAKAILEKPQAHVIYEHIYTFIHTNLFIPCWKEIKQVMTLMEGKGQLGADSKKGELHMRLVQGTYYQSLKLTIPPLYPEEGVAIEFGAANFPADIQFMFRCQAEEIARRCVSGQSADQALETSNPIRFAATADTTKPVTNLTSGNLLNLKHDVSVLKNISDLRDASVAKGKKGQYGVQASGERREARKDLRRLAEEEAQQEGAEQRRRQEEEHRLVKALIGCTVSEVAQPSLLTVCRFLTDSYASLPLELCQACATPVLSQQATDCIATPSGKRPVRTFCGHWLHHGCLDNWLSQPPFIRQCPACQRRIWHPDWPEDPKVLEKAWQNKMAKKREVCDVSDFMGMDDAFSTDAAKSGRLRL